MSIMSFHQEPEEELLVPKSSTSKNGPTSSDLSNHNLLAKSTSNNSVHTSIIKPEVISLSTASDNTLTLNALDIDTTPRINEVSGETPQTDIEDTDDNTSDSDHFTTKLPDEDPDPRQKIECFIADYHLKTEIEVSPVASSNYFCTNVELIQLGQHSIHDFFQKSITSLKTCRISLKECILKEAKFSKKEINASLQLLDESLHLCKNRICSLAKLPHGTLSQRNLKCLQLNLNSYQNSLRRIRKTAEQIIKGHIELLRFCKKFTPLFIIKEGGAFPNIVDFLTDLISLMTNVGCTKLFTELAYQQNYLKEIRICVDAKVESRDKIGVRERTRSINLQENIQKVFEFQDETLPKCAKAFLTSVYGVANEFIDKLEEKEEEHEYHYETLGDKFNQIWEDIKMKYPLTVLDRIRHKKFTPVVHSKPVISHRPKTANEDSIRAGAGSASEGCSQTVQDMSSAISSQKSVTKSESKMFSPKSRSGNPKPFSKLMSYWSTHLSSLFLTHSRNKTDKISTLEEISSVNLEKLNTYLVRHRTACYIQIKMIQKINLNNLKSRIKLCLPTQQIPTAIDLLDLDSLEMPQDAKSTKLSPLDKYIAKIKEQNKQVLEILLKWTSEFLTMVETSSQEFCTIVQHNLATEHIDPWQLRHNLLQTGEIIIQSFTEEVKLAVNDCYDLVQILVGKLKLDVNFENFENTDGNNNTEESQNQMTKVVKLRLQKLPLLSRLEEDKIRVETVIMVFTVHFRTAMFQYLEKHFETCCQHIQTLFNGRLTLTKKAVKMIHKSLVIFAKARRQPGLSHIVISSANRQSESEYVQSSGSFVNNEEANQTNEETNRFESQTNVDVNVNIGPGRGQAEEVETVEKDNCLSECTRTTLAQIPSWVTGESNVLGSKRSCNRSRSRSKSKKDLRLLPERKGSEFVESYISAARMEKDVPEWAEDNL